VLDYWLVPVPMDLVMVERPDNSYSIRFKRFLPQLVLEHLEQMAFQQQGRLVFLLVYFL
jgi:hypothetical protein